MFSLFVYVPCGVGEARMSQGLAVGSNGGFLGARESLNVGWKIIGRNIFEINVVASDFLIRYRYTSQISDLVIKLLYLGS
jgi:hypothetical protein